MKREDLMIYAITDRQWLKDQSFVEAVEAALRGGATMVQLREKDLSEPEVREFVELLQPLCQSYRVPLIINDYVDVALAIGADGVHVGQSDAGAIEVREKLGADKILGVSCRTLEEALTAQEQGADYIGVGAIFHTDTKGDAEAVSLTTLKEIVAHVTIPVVAIGGIHYENLEELAGTGIAGVAVVSAIFAEEDIEMATKTFKEKVVTIL